MKKPLKLPKIMHKKDWSYLFPESSLKNQLSTELLVSWRLAAPLTILYISAIARAAGIIINWEDMSQLSECIPLITRMYPNGAADVNHFHAAGGMPFVIHSLLSNGLLHEDVTTILGHGMDLYTQESKIINGKLEFAQGSKISLNENVVRPVNDPFSHHGGIKILSGNIGRSVIKNSRRR